MEVQEPFPGSGITTSDVKEAIRRAREDAKKYPALNLLLQDVPAVYETDKSTENGGV